MAAYPTAFQRPSGGERHLALLAESLRRHVSSVDRFDPWTTQLSDFDVLHYFSSYGSDSFPELRRFVPVLAVTPLIWPALPRRVLLARNALRAAQRITSRPHRGPFDAVDVLFPMSQSEADLLVRNYHVPRTRIATVPHGADPRFAEPPTGAFADAFGATDFVFCPARIDPNKNQLRLVRALADADVDLIVAGDVAPGHEEYASACRAAAGARTRFLPALPHESEELRDAIVTAACVVIPSEFELLSMAALEAGIAGTPLALTTGGGMVEHYSPYAEFFDPRVEREIRDAVFAAVGRGRRPGQQEHFRSKFSWDNIARRTVEAYNRCL